jgi:diadenylate cyclase
MPSVAIAEMLSTFLDFLRATDFSWHDVLDILLVAYIIYRLLQFIRGTHTVQMALGACVLVVLYWASKWADLETINWMLRTFLPYLVFGVIVVFQSEIRKVLAHLGKTPFRGAFLARKQEEVLDEIVLAATTLASQRTGAIVVIERELGLRSYIETGIALDALVTYDLLISIFNPGTPLHDGAVILQANRVAAAACFLPLTVNPELSRTLGSRHRAAIGITEDTDALAVVVSEETGIISIVSSGRIKRDLDGRALTQALHEGLAVADERKATPEQKSAPVDAPQASVAKGKER